ncbi:MAG: hypothetical protein M1833_003703 [Piccolia ochrophora]|nr:MAG: hypothetical protein M1833_003703 [Piccolia ochrophora]
MSTSSEVGRQKFLNYPEPKFGPERPYKNITPTNPVVRGRLLSIAGSLIASLTWVQDILWSNAGFADLRKIAELDDYDCRYTPTVIPIEDASASPKSFTASTPPPRDQYRGGYYTASDLHALYKSRKLTPIAVAEALLPLIQRDSSPPGKHSVAFLDSKVDIIRKAAEASTQRYKEGASLGVLDGVPVAVKDEVDLTGYKRNNGSPRDFTSKQNVTSWCVRKWEEAGAVIMGKLNMHELGMDTTNNNPLTGTPLNPHNPHYYTGGSSGGSGYVASTGLVPIALGADGGGSIRIPAAYCGVYGLKPSHERVSASPSIGMASTTGVFGPLASTMADLELSYRLMAAPDPSNPPSSLFASPRPLTSPRPKLLGIYPAWFSRADPSVATACRTALDHLTSPTGGGYTLIDIAIPFLPEGQLAHAMTILTEISESVHGDTRGLTPANKVVISVGTRTPATDFLRAQALRNLLMRHLAALFRAHPGLVIVTPTTPNAGCHIAGGAADLLFGVSDANMSVRSMEFAWLANFTGTPSLSVPVAYVDAVQGEGKIPVGLMATGEWGSEDALIEWGKDCEAWLTTQKEGGRRRPEGWVDLVKLAEERMGKVNGA